MTEDNKDMSKVSSFPCSSKKLVFSSLLDHVPNYLLFQYLVLFLFEGQSSDLMSRINQLLDTKEKTNPSMTFSSLLILPVFDILTLLKSRL